MQIKLDAEKIKKRREEHRWTQNHLADAAGLSLRTIQRIENGESASSETVMALAAAFDVNFTSLLAETDAAKDKTPKDKRRDIRAALRVGLLINLACYGFGLVVFTAISLSDGQEGFAMLLPAIWWGVGVAGFALATCLVEILAHFQDKAEAENTSS